MAIPALFSVLVAAGGEGHAGYEVHLNRSSINSIDVPQEKILSEPGGLLRIRFMNHGAPIHITITESNAREFTSFFHENLYIADESTLAIPILRDCPP
ncbi:MAG TPA: hypothetical protein VHN82_02020, partial [Methanoregula sp.]|nr:hypothetical protein [Methanoregula sp.]